MSKYDNSDEFDEEVDKLGELLRDEDHTLLAQARLMANWSESKIRTASRRFNRKISTLQKRAKIGRDVVTDPQYAKYVENVASGKWPFQALVELVRLPDPKFWDGALAHLGAGTVGTEPTGINISRAIKQYLDQDQVQLELAALGEQNGKARTKSSTIHQTARFQPQARKDRGVTNDPAIHMHLRDGQWLDVEIEDPTMIDLEQIASSLSVTDGRTSLTIRLKRSAGYWDVTRGPKPIQTK